MIREKQEILLFLYKSNLKNPNRGIATIEDLMGMLGYTNRNLLLSHLKYLKDKEYIHYTPMIGDPMPVHNIFIDPYGIDYVEEHLNLEGMVIKE